MKKLLVLTALLEAGTGVGLLLAPALVVRVLLGASLDPAGGVAVGRVAGAALLALSVACWGARDGGLGPAVTGIIRAMLLYNGLVAALLVYLRCGPGLSGVGLWPVVVLHAGLGVWCVVCLRPGPSARAG